MKENEYPNLNEYLGLAEGEIEELVVRAEEALKEAIDFAVDFKLEQGSISSHCGEKMVKFSVYKKEDAKKENPIKIIHLCRMCEYYFIQKFGV